MKMKLCKDCKFFEEASNKEAFCLSKLTSVDPTIGIYMYIYNRFLELCQYPSLPILTIL